MSTASVHDRLVQSATLLLRSRGADGFGMSELLDHSRVARRSMYQHFPAGKAQLLQEATADAGARLETLLGAVLAERGAVETLDLWTAQWKRILADSDYALGCPLAAASLASQEYPAAAAAAATTFERFAALIADAFERDGLPPSEAAVAGTVIVSGMEGAIITARALRSTEPFDTFADHIRSVWGPADQ